MNMNLLVVILVILLLCGGPAGGWYYGNQAGPGYGTRYSGYGLVVSIILAVLVLYALGIIGGGHSLLR